jgi:hypothetical protein
LAPFDPAGEPLAECAAGDKPLVIADLSQAKGELLKTMAARGARSSMHVPVEVAGVRGTVNFWSRDPDAFPQPVAQLLTMVAKGLKVPEGKPPGISD